jgi:flagellar motor switch/type III secretory pathway protein FliN
MTTQPVRPIYVPGATALESLQERAWTALQSWGRDWIAGWPADPTRLGSLRVTAPVRKEAGKSWEQFGSMWFQCGLTESEQLANAITGELITGSGIGDDWMRDLVDRAWRSRNEALSGALVSDTVAAAEVQVTSELPSSLFALGSGAVEIACRPLGLHAIADSSVWRTIAPPALAHQHSRPRVGPLEAALRARGTKVRLDVMLGAVEVELAGLSDLRRGDVLNLPSRLDGGIEVLCEGQPLAQAFLGAVRGRKCVRLLGHQDRVMKHEDDRK